MSRSSVTRPQTACVIRSVWPCQAAITSAAIPAARIREMFECRSLPSVIALSPGVCGFEPPHRVTARPVRTAPAVRSAPALPSRWAFLLPGGASANNGNGLSSYDAAGSTSAAVADGAVPRGGATNAAAGSGPAAAVTAGAVGFWRRRSCRMHWAPAVAPGVRGCQSTPGKSPGGRRRRFGSRPSSGHRRRRCRLTRSARRGLRSC